MSSFLFTLLLKPVDKWCVGVNEGLPGSVWQLPVEGGAPWDSCLVLLQDLLALQAVGALRGRASGEGRSSSGGHPMPGGVSPEGCLVLAGRPLAVDLVLHHGYAVQLRAAPAAQNRGEGWWLSDTVGAERFHTGNVKRCSVVLESRF